MTGLALLGRRLRSPLIDETLVQFLQPGPLPATFTGIPCYDAAADAVVGQNGNNGVTDTASAAAASAGEPKFKFAAASAAVRAKGGLWDVAGVWSQVDSIEFHATKLTVPYRLELQPDGTARFGASGHPAGGRVVGEGIWRLHVSRSHTSVQ